MHPGARDPCLSNSVPVARVYERRNIHTDTWWLTAPRHASQRARAAVAGSLGARELVRECTPATSRARRHAHARLGPAADGWP